MCNISNKADWYNFVSATKCETTSSRHQLINGRERMIDLYSGTAQNIQNIAFPPTYNHSWVMDWYNVISVNQGRPAYIKSEPLFMSMSCRICRACWHVGPVCHWTGTMSHKKENSINWNLWWKREQLIISNLRPSRARWPERLTRITRSGFSKKKRSRARTGELKPRQPLPVDTRGNSATGTYRSRTPPRQRPANRPRHFVEQATRTASERKKTSCFNPPPTRQGNRITLPRAHEAGTHRSEAQARQRGLELEGRHRCCRRCRGEPCHLSTQLGPAPAALVCPLVGSRGRLECGRKGLLLVAACEGWSG